MIIFRSLFLLASLLACWVPLSGQTGCDTYFPMRPGATWQKDFYDAEGTLLRTSHVKLTAVVADPSAVMVVETMERGPEKKLHTSQYAMTCTESGLVIDLAGKVNSAYISIPARTIEAASPGLVYPNSLAVGTTLPSTTLVVNYMDGESVSMRHTTLIHNRRVTGQEVKQVAAGSFDCLVLEEDHLFDDGETQQHSTVKIWLSPGCGIVATESLLDGKRTAYSELSGLQR